jgi:hypothetical protein
MHKLTIDAGTPDSGVIRMWGMRDRPRSRRSPSIVMLCMSPARAQPLVRPAARVRRRTTGRAGVPITLSRCPPLKTAPAVTTEDPGADMYSTAIAACHANPAVSRATIAGNTARFGSAASIVELCVSRRRLRRPARGCRRESVVAAPALAARPGDCRAGVAARPGDCRRESVVAAPAPARAARPADCRRESVVAPPASQPPSPDARR